MNSYIVRIYRSVSENQSSPVGVVEDVEGRRQGAFRSIEELWRLLIAPKDRSLRQSSVKAQRSTKRV